MNVFLRNREKVKAVDILIFDSLLKDVKLIFQKFLLNSQLFEVADTNFQYKAILGKSIKVYKTCHLICKCSINIQTCSTLKVFEPYGFRLLWWVWVSSSYSYLYGTIPNDIDIIILDAI